MMTNQKLTYSEYIQTFDSGLFTELDKLEPLPWRDVYTPEQLDILFLFKYGDKPVLKSLRTLELDTLAELVYTSFRVKWKQIYESLNTDTPLNEKYKIIIDEVIQSDDELTLQGTTTDKEGAFNTDTLVTSGGVEQDSTTSNRENRERLNEQTRTDSETLQKNLRFLERNLFNDIVLKDVNDLILLKIY